MENSIHKIIISVCTFVFLASGWGMYAVSMYEDAGEATQASVIGLAEIVENEVKRKPTGSLSWFGVRNGTPLSHRDVIFVGDEAQTTLALNDGSRLTVGKNSLIVLDLDQRSLESGGSQVTEIRLVRGDLAVQKSENSKQANRPARDLNIVIGKNLKLNLKKAGSLAVGKRGGKLDLVVKSGAVKVAVNDKKQTKEFDIKFDKPSVIRDVPIEVPASSSFEVVTEKIQKQEKIETEVKEESENLLKFVPQRDVASEKEDEEIQAAGNLDNITKESMNVAAVPPAPTGSASGNPGANSMTNGPSANPAPGTAATQAIPGQEIPPTAAVPNLPPADSGDSLKASKVPLVPTKVLDMAAATAKVNVELPEEILSEKGPVKLEMSFTKNFEETFLKLPVDVSPDSRHYDIDLSYLLEVPGFKKKAQQNPRLYWRVSPDRFLTSDEEAKFPIRWVALRTPKSTVVKLSPDQFYLKEGEGEFVLPLRWTFRGIFVDRFQVTVFKDKSFGQIVCQVQVPNSSFIDPSKVEVDEQGFKLFTYELHSSPECPIAELAQAKKAMYVRVDLIDPDGRLVPADKTSKPTAMAKSK